MRTENLEFYNEIKREVKALMNKYGLRVNRRLGGIDGICEYIIDAVDNDAHAVQNIRKTFNEIREMVDENTNTKYLLKK